MAQQSSAPNMKLYWWSFGITLTVLAVIGIAYLVLSGESNLPSNFDESELPALPAEEGDDVDGGIAALPGETTNNEVSSTDESETVGGNADSTFVGTWRVYSERLFYDEGGGGTTLSASSGTAVTQKLSLENDGTYSYGSTKGTWSIEPISSSDWTSWNINSYGPTRKMTLTGWNKGVASGPIEEEAGTVNFVWVLYHVEPPTVSKPGIVHLKFWH